MPWFEPCTSHGYSKFYSNPQLRQDRWIVSDEYLESLLRAFRQGYVNAGGPDYEDTDSNLLDTLAEACVGSTSAAAELGADQARKDIAAHQDPHPTSIQPGGDIPSTPPMGTPANIDPATGMVYAPPTVQTNPTGQPGANPVMQPPSGGGGGYFPSAPVQTAGVGSTGGIPWLLIGGAAVVLYLMTRKG